MSARKEALWNLAAVTLELVMFYAILGGLAWWISSETGMAFWKAVIGIVLATMLVKSLIRESRP
jgi:hypothetical protein